MPPSQEICMLHKGCSDPAFWSQSHGASGMDNDLPPFWRQCTWDSGESWICPGKRREKKQLSSQHMMASPTPRVDTAIFRDGLYASWDAVCTWGVGGRPQESAGPESDLEKFLDIWYWRGREEQTKVLVHPCSQIWLVDFHDIYHTNLDNAQDNTEHFLRMWGTKKAAS